MNYEVYHIPSNFTDAGRIMGLFELRNLVEAVWADCKDHSDAGGRCTGGRLRPYWDQR